jgi:hypothetical protein
MISTVGTGLLGLSLGCARCHEHKYDPIPQQDYYRLIATLARTDSASRKIDPDPEAFRRLKAAFDKEHAPIAAARAKFEKEELPDRFAKWYEAEKGKPTTPWLTLEPARATTARGPLKKLDDGSFLATSKAEKTDTYTFTARTSLKGVVALRVEVLSDPSLPKMGPGRAPDGNFCLTSVSVVATPTADATKKGAKPLNVKLKAGAATFEQSGHGLNGAIDADPKTGWSVGGSTGKNHAAIFTTETPVGFDGTQLTITLKFERDFAAGRLRLAIATAKDAKLDGAAQRQSVGEILTLAAAQAGKLDGKNRSAIGEWFRHVDAKTDEVFEAFERSAAKEPKPPFVNVFAATSGRGGDVHFLIRGEVDRKDGVAKPGFVSVLMNTPDQGRRWLQLDKTKTPPPPRVALANWITDDKHGAGHLLARVIVNRLWQHHFGKGIVRTPNDFGAQGEPPTHPELLDWLAAQLIKGDWKLKPIHKLIMTSAAYAQSGEANEVAQKEDPQNRLWWRVPPRRLEAEAIRDSLLVAGASLDEKPFGPGTLDDNNPRRSIYLTVKRSRLSPTLQAFDAPEGIQSVGERSSTTATTQALVMMNSRFVRAQAEKLAARVRPDKLDVPGAIEKAYRIAIGRKPNDAEAKKMTAFVRRLADESGKSPQALEMAMSDFCQVLLCLNEFVYVD